MKSQSNPAPQISRSEVMRLTWQLVSKAKISFAVALKKAWATIRLKAQMMMKPVSFFYVKGDGTERFAVGHFASATTPATGDAKSTGPLQIRYFDTLAGGWRSFRADRLIVA